MIKEASENKYDIVIFPELAYSGYSLSSEKLQSLAEPLSGPFVKAIRKKQRIQNSRNMWLSRS